MEPVRLKEAGLADAATIAALARKIWYQNYTEMISTEQIEYMLNNMYNQDSLGHQMKELGHRFFFISTGQDPIGFISTGPEPENTWVISKFYIDSTNARKGLGTAVFEQIKKITGSPHFRLTVNRQNFKAINFYFKLGFRIREVADFDIGGGYFMNDFVMVWDQNKVHSQ